MRWRAAAATLLATVLCSAVSGAPGRSRARAEYPPDRRVAGRAGASEEGGEGGEISPAGDRAGFREARRDVDPRALASAIARYDRVEPSVDRVVRAALAANAPSPTDLDALTTRARLSGLLPTLRLGAQRGTGWDLSERLDDDSRVQLGTDDELSLRAEAVFPLDRLLFAREEVPLARELRAVQRVRRELVRAVVGLYYERRRLMLERDLVGAGGVGHTVRIEEATALLDAFTAGRFRSMLRPP